MIIVNSTIANINKIYEIKKKILLKKKYIYIYIYIFVLYHIKTCITL
jgi:hypothetical protein